MPACEEGLPTLVILRDDIPEIIIHREEIGEELSLRAQAVLKKGVIRASTFRLAEIEWVVSQKINDSKHAASLSNLLSAQTRNFCNQFVPKRDVDPNYTVSVQYRAPGRFRISMIRLPVYWV